MLTLNLKLQPTADISANELEALNQYWQQALLEAGVEAIEPVKVAAPDGARPIDLAMFDQFFLQVSTSVATTVITASVFGLWNWLKTPGNDLVKFEFSDGENSILITSAMSKAEAGKLADKFAKMVGQATKKQPPKNR